MIKIERFHQAEGRPLQLEIVGNNPKQAVVAGFHGHEYRTIGRLRTALNQSLVSHSSIWEDHLRVLNAHPAAISARSRTSLSGVDLNRQFATGQYQPEAIYPTAKQLQDIFSRFANLQIIWSFHGEADEPGEPAKPFYMYDTPRFSGGKNQAIFDELVQNLTSTIASIDDFAGSYSSGLHTGWDCNDLGNWVDQGYTLLPADSEGADNGSFESWAAAGYTLLPADSEGADNGSFESWAAADAAALPNLERTVLFEIPDYLSIGHQQRMIQLIIDRLIIPYSQYLLQRDLR